MEAFGDYKGKAKAIIGRHMYMVLATAGRNGSPWACPVFYAHDSEFNFYFMSATDSLHIKNVMENNKVGIAIFDSNAEVGSSDEVQAIGKVSMVEKEELRKVIEIYAKKLYPKSPMAPTDRYRPDDYSGASEFRFFKITIEKLFTTGPERRVEVDLKPKTS